MRLKSLELQLEWPQTLPIEALRNHVIEHVTNFGEPIRWAITSVVFSSESLCIRELIIEAVVIIT